MSNIPEFINAEFVENLKTKVHNEMSKVNEKRKEKIHFADYSDLLLEGSDDAMVEIFCDLECENIKLLSKKGPMYVWNNDNKLWEQFDVEYLYSRFIGKVLKPLYKSAIYKLSQELENQPKIRTVDISKDKDEIEEQKKIYQTLQKNLKKLRQTSKKQSIYKILTKELVDENFSCLLNSKSNLLPIKSDIFGQHIVVDLKTGESRQRKKDDYFSYELNIFYNPVASCPQFDLFMNQITYGNENIKKDLQNIFGYSITGERHEKMAFILRGSGNNGKSAFISILNNLLYVKNNQFLTSANPGILSIDYKRCSVPTPELFKIKDSRIVVLNEFGNVHVNVEAFKTLTSGGFDQLETRTLYGDPINFIPKFKMFIITNNDPNINEDQAILNRIKIIDFKARFVDDPALVNPNKHIYLQDLYIIEKILNDENEKSGILNWLITGAINYYKNGLKLSEVVQETIKEFKSHIDTVNNFINDYCEFGEDKNIKASDLYSHYKDYCTDNFMTPLSNVLFVRRLLDSRRDIQKKHTKTGNIYIGINVKLT